MSMEERRRQCNCYFYFFFYGCEMNEWDFYYGLVGGVKTWKEEELTAVTDWRRVSCVFHDGAFNAPIIPIMQSVLADGNHVVVRQDNANFHILRPPRGFELHCIHQSFTNCSCRQQIINLIIYISNSSALFFKKIKNCIYILGLFFE